MDFVGHLHVFNMFLKISLWNSEAYCMSKLHPSSWNVILRWNIWYECFFFQTFVSKCYSDHDIYLLPVHEFQGPLKILTSLRNGQCKSNVDLFKRTHTSNSLSYVRSISILTVFSVTGSGGTPNSGTRGRGGFTRMAAAGTRPAIRTGLAYSWMSSCLQAHLENNHRLIYLTSERALSNLVTPWVDYPIKALWHTRI